MRQNVRHVATPFGDIAYTEKGSGPAALFVRGVLLNGYWWRHVIDGVADVRRCIAIDQLAHGATRTPAEQDVSCKAQAEMLEAVCAALGLDEVDLVANDTGGSIAQIFAARHPQRIRSLTLTNCEVHDNWRAAAPGARAACPWSTALRMRGEVQPLLRRLHAPTLVVWGTDDVYFPVKWAYWLRGTIPGCRKVIELEGARLFFPGERPAELAKALREHWRVKRPAAPATATASG